MKKRTKVIPQPDDLSQTKGIFNFAVATMRREVLGTVKEPMTLSPEETRRLATDLILLKLEVAEWKEKWQRRKDTMNDWVDAALEAQKNLRTIIGANEMEGGK